MSGLGELFRWCAKVIPVILTVAETASKIAKYVNDITSSFKKTSDFMNDVRGRNSENPKSTTKAKSGPNVMGDDSTHKGEFSDIMIIVNEHGRRLEAATSENKVDHNKISLQIKIIELISMHSMVDRFVNNINLHAANLQIHAQSIENMARVLNDLKRHGYAIRRMLRVINYTANKVNSNIVGNPIEKLEGIDVEDDLNTEDIFLSIKLFEMARSLLIDEANKFSDYLEVQIKNVEEIRNSAAKVPDKAVVVASWLNDEICPQLNEARICVSELRARIDLLPPIGSEIRKQLSDYPDQEL